MVLKLGSLRELANGRMKISGLPTIPMLPQVSGR